MYITMYGSQNVKFTVVVNYLEVGSVVFIMNFTVSESYGISDRYQIPDFSYFLTFEPVLQ